MTNYRYVNRELPFKTGIISPNRLYFSPVGYDLCDANGLPLPEFNSTYEQLIYGGAGFGFIGNASIDPASYYTDRGLKITTEAHSALLRPLLTHAAERDFILAVQLQHYGVKQHASDQRADPARASGDVSHLTDVEIDEFIEMFVSAASRAVRAGAKAIQIQAANGYLLSCFLSPRTNKRADKWGGTPLRRAEAILEVVRRIRTAVGRSELIFVRLQVDDGFGSLGIQPEGIEDVAAAIACAGADAITCATGVAETFAHFLGNASATISTSLRASQRIRAASGVPVGFAANLRSVDDAEEILATGDVDFLGFGRALIADPLLIRKEMTGASDQVYRCRWDSFCLRDKKNTQLDRVHCCVNPSMRRPASIQAQYEEDDDVLRR